PTAPVGQSADRPVSENGALPGPQADGAEVYLLTVFPRTPLRRDPGPLLWRQLLGFTCDRIHSAATRRRAGTASSPGYSGNGQPRHCLHRVQAFTGRVPAFLRAGMGPGLVGHQVPARYR